MVVVLLKVEHSVKYNKNINMSYRNPQIIVDRSAEIYAQGAAKTGVLFAQGIAIDCNLCASDTFCCCNACSP